jgi:hypothetical protein
MDNESAVQMRRRQAVKRRHPDQREDDNAASTAHNAILQFIRRLAAQEYPHQLYYPFPSTNTIVCSMIRLEVRDRPFGRLCLIAYVTGV